MVAKSIGSASKATVYGSRDGCLPGLACISKDTGNIFRSSKAMKTGVIHEVHMLPRNEFYKPPATLMQ